MSVSIKVSIRCRPFTCDDKLGVVLTQSAEEEGEVQLINSTHSTTRFGFSYAWWSAYGYQWHVHGDPPEVDQVTLIDQQAAYDSVGLEIKSDLLSGNAVVLFAYGLSGSGKTFIVFGPDAVDIPEAWFKHEEPQPLVRICPRLDMLITIIHAVFLHQLDHHIVGDFPRLAYELFKEKQDGWKISMKYFQNVVNTVRDLMSPVTQEQQYKSGMRKDADGFTGIEWCQSVVLKDWNDLRKNFMAANAKKAIAQTRLSHQSTRGHCIMTLEAEKPDPEREGMKQRGRVYVCDLAGTEPAGDIVYAEHKKIVFDSDEIEHKYIGPHPDASKSKELQDRGKKINLSLTEMAQFFMKMAEAVMANKLKPGVSIPGCDSYFLCKYLKDTMLQARTHLFCAIRPEVKFHGYTFSTLGFAKNASVIKLQPKKASAAASAAERKLMAELEQMKMLVNQLKEENERMAKIRAERGDGGGAVMAGHDGSGMDTSQVDQLSELLNMKQRELEKVVSGESDGSGVGKRNTQDEMMQRQREEYGKRGIHLYHFESETKSPYLIDLDVDAYRSKRFMFLLDKPHITVGGMQGDIKPMSLSIADGHCTFTDENDGETISVVAGAGDVMHNGKKLEKGLRQELTAFDRVVIGNELTPFMYPGRELAQQEPPTADDAAAEYQKALQTVDNATIVELQAQMKKFEEEKANWEKQKVEREAAGSLAPLPDLQAGAQEAAVAIGAKKEKELLARQVNDQELREVLPKIVELQQIVKALNRDVLSFETALQSSSVDEKNSGGIPKVKVKVYNMATDETIFLDVFEFVKAHALLKDEVAFLKNAIMNDREYESPEGHDPITLLFDNSFHVGSATTFPEYLLYNLEADPEESYLSIKLAVSPFNTIGKLEVLWIPLSSPDIEKHNEDDVMDVEGPSDLLGKPWTFKIQIKGATGLPLITDLVYCQYEFLGELFTTETVEQNTRSPVFNYEGIHHVSCVTQQFVDYLQNTRIEFQIYVNPYILDPPKDKISTKNPAIYAQLSGDGKAKLFYEVEQVLEIGTHSLQPSSSCTPRKQLESAKATDFILNSDKSSESKSADVAAMHPNEAMNFSNAAPAGATAACLPANASH
ncbi:Kinesin-like protein, partial [Globisporangium splendens]